MASAVLIDTKEAIDVILVDAVLTLLLFLSGTGSLGLCVHADGQVCGAREPARVRLVAVVGRRRDDSPHNRPPGVVGPRGGEVVVLARGAARRIEERPVARPPSALSR